MDFDQYQKKKKKKKCRNKKFLRMSLKGMENKKMNCNR